jgi:single-strand DNA-binding protein
MNNLNSTLIEGNLVYDPVIKYTPKGTAVCNLTIASSRYYRQDTGFEKEVSFFGVETWSTLAEACYKQGKKGRGVRVVGRLRQDRWTGTDGKEYSRISIVAEHVEFRPEFGKNKKDDTENAENKEESADDEEIFYSEEEQPVDELVDESTAEEIMTEEALA